jgi:bifunctional non-homologous end joining protein LigD
MLARAGELPPRQEDWGFEVKWDGVRAIAYSEPGRLRLESRNLRDITASYPELKRLNRALHHHEAVLDGEIVAFGDDGRPSFERLQSRMHIASEAQARRRAEGAPVTYVIFDLLWLDGHSLMDLPYAERRERLAELELDGDQWKVPAHHVGAGTALLEATRAQGLEGIVAKRLDCPYQPGRRSPGWVKVKNVARQELVIGGWLPGEGRRRERIGALLVGYHDDAGALRYAGRVGTGFDDRELDRLAGLLAERERPDSPFEGEPRPPKGAQFAEPDLVCEVEFTAWTRDGMLRHPSYKGLRDDKPAVEVVREPAPVLATAGEEVDAVPDPGSGDEPALAELVASGREVKGGVEIELEGRTLKLSNLDKVLYPETGFTKGDAIDYALRIAPVLLPHLRDRPLTLKRYPDGVEGKFFFEKNCPKHRPEWVETVPVTSSRAKTGTVDYCLCQDLPTLVWLANLAAIELHPSLSHVPQLERPSMLVFDLDPGPPATIVECCRVAQLLRGMFGQLGLESWPKTSGSKGLQVYVPLNVDVTYERTKPFAKAVAETLERGAGELVVSRQAKELRPGKVLVDWSQNDEAKTTISVYSLRARARPTVSTPVTWDEVDACAEAGDPDLLVFQAGDVLERVGRDGDLFAPVLTEVHALPDL